MNEGFGVGNLMTLASFGYMIYSLFNQKESDRPEAQEIQLNNYTRDTPVPIVYGVNRIAGTCIWMGNTRAEYIEPGGGKGIAFLAMMFMNGQSQSEPYGWYYYADFALGLSEGPIIDIRKFFLNSNEMGKYWGYWEYDYELGNGSQIINSLVSDSLGSSAIPWRYTANLVMSGNLGQVNYLPTIETEIVGLLASSEQTVEETFVRVENYTGECTFDWPDVHRTPLQIDLDNNGNIICLLTDQPIGMYDHTPKTHVTSQITPFEDWAELGYSSRAYFEGYMNAFNLEHHPPGCTGYFPWCWGGYTNFVKTEDEDELACICYFYNGGYGGWLVHHYAFFVSIETGLVTRYFYIGMSSQYPTRSPNCWEYYTHGHKYCLYLGGEKFLTRVLNWAGGMLYNWMQLERYKSGYTDPEVQTDAAFTELVGYNINRHIDIFNYSDHTQRTSSGAKFWYFEVIYGGITSAYKLTSSIYGFKKLFDLPAGCTGGHLFSMHYDEESRSYWYLYLTGRGADGKVYVYKNQELIYSYSGVSWDNGYIYGAEGCNIHVFKDHVWIATETYGTGDTTYPNRIMFLGYIHKGSHDVTTLYYGLTGPSRDMWANVFFEYNDQLYLLDHSIPGRGFGQRDRIRRLDTFVEDNDPNPIEVCYDFMTNERYGLGIPAAKFDGSPTTTGTWKIESDYCDVLIDIGDGSGLTERRFMYADALTNRKKAYDIIREILSTCRGFIYYCDGKIKVKIEKGTETCEFYFGHDEYITLTAA